MPDDPQDTLCVPALKFYNQARSTRVEALAWLRVVSKEGHTITVPTIPIYHRKNFKTMSLLIYINCPPPS